MASCKCGVKDDRPGSPPCDCEKIGNDDPIDGAVSSQERARTLAQRELDHAIEAVVSPRADAKRTALEKMANTRQVGGSHYGLGALQHWDIVALFNLDYFQGNISKYVFRWREKGGVQDLEKAQHYLEKYIEEIKAGHIQEPHP